MSNDQEQEKEIVIKFRKRPRYQWTSEVEGTSYVSHGLTIKEAFDNLLVDMATAALRALQR